MNRKALIEKYEKLMYKFGEFDVWEEDIKPRLDSMTTEEINRNYKQDKEFYTSREEAGGWW